MSANGTARAPRITVMLRQDPKIISPDILQECAGRIRDGADEEGRFEDAFQVGDVWFEIGCRLVFSPFREDRGAITGVIFNYATAETLDCDGYYLPNDFTEAELLDYITG